MFDGVAEKGPDLGPQQPIPHPERQTPCTNGGENVPRDGSGDSGVAEEGREEGKPEGADPKGRGERPGVQFLSLLFPRFGLRIRQVQKPGGNENWE